MRASWNGIGSGCKKAIKGASGAALGVTSFHVSKL
jgi:hypothetical protein